MSLPSLKDNISAIYNYVQDCFNNHITDYIVLTDYMEAREPTAQKFARISVRIVDQRESGFAVSVSDFGKRRYRNSAVLQVQFFGPKTLSNSLFEIRGDAQALRSYLLNKHPDGGCEKYIDFTNVSCRDFEANSTSYRVTLSASVTFDEVQ